MTATISKPISKATSRRDRIRQQLADLKMPGALESLDQILASADGIFNRS